MSQLNFINDDYRNIALNLRYSELNIHNYIDAFFLIINGMDRDSLSNLCDKMLDNSYLLCGDIKITKEQCYELTQRLDLCDEVKKVIYNLAEECIVSGMFLGTKMTGPFNTSSWVSHSYYVGECCANLASILGLDSDKAKTYGLLHDIGRKKDHGFKHVIYGFQDLVSVGWTDESIACLTHSFVKGGRCSNNEQAVLGFYVDEDGNAAWKEGISKDDVTLFLEGYQYNAYDLILNIADLMATSDGIVSPYERIKDIATRKVLDPTNRGYFLADITNVFIDFLKKINYIDKNTLYIKARKDVSLNEIEDRFNEISQYFYNIYKMLLETRGKTKKLEM